MGPAPTKPSIELAGFDAILGQSVATEEIYEFGKRAASVDAPVLITGESGTGKGLLARAIHAGSERASRPLIAVNCAGIPESLFESEFFGHTRGAFTGAHEARRGLFEQADGGTLFLDEIGELTLALQAKLLTAIEDGEIRRLGAERTRKVDVRIIAATGVDLEEAVYQKRFRRDLYHRLLVLSYHLPPLREREGDIEHLAEHFLQRYRKKYKRPISGFEPGAVHLLREYRWPGNIRELEHAVEAAVLSCDQTQIGVQNLPRNILNSPPIRYENDAGGDAYPEMRKGQRYSFYGDPEKERARIIEVLKRHRGNRTRTADALGMARNTLRKKMREYGIE